ncbi:hypothetical protein [Flavihumibacter fluvii]|uniref:hypothetical protein n=1 Tax=Flavihumibacter fluvii TaxID=2838157 RepID=UPI001BDE3DDE|nr:hypothetical protein [Flavihumibacter fluvii]ULQ51487.1 hypothetical protein KJS93_15470 [Flavihumibacter fluvii]
MAISNDNILVRNIYGGFGKQVVFRQRGDKTIMAAWPTVDKNRKPTPDQSIAQSAFQRAVYFAQFARKDENLIAVYKKLARKGQSVYHAAISDAKMPPELSNLQVDGYTGRPGQQLIITATDNYKVARVQCSIFAPDGQLLESGEAVRQFNDYHWAYTTTHENTSLPGTTVKFSAFDIPENETVLTLTL